MSFVVRGIIVSCGHKGRRGESPGAKLNTIKDVFTLVVLVLIEGASNLLALIS